MGYRSAVHAGAVARGTRVLQPSQAPVLESGVNGAMGFGPTTGYIRRIHGRSRVFSRSPFPCGAKDMLPCYWHARKPAEG